MSTAATTPSGPDPGPTLLVVGGTGHLGRTLLARAPRPPGGRILATHRGAPPARSGVAWRSLALDDGGEDAAALIRSLAPAAVVNAAYVARGPDLAAVTARAPGAMAAACASVGARFVHVSSDVVFSGTADRPYVESDPPDPVHPYGAAKAEAEARVTEADPGAVIVRTSLLWGIDDPGAQVELVRDPDVVFFTDEIRCPLRVDRLADACLELADRADVTGPLHVAGADAVDRLTFARLIAPIAGRRPDELRGAPGHPADPPRPARLPLDVRRARMLLDSPLPGVRSDAAACHGATP